MTSLSHPEDLDHLAGRPEDLDHLAGRPEDLDHLAGRQLADREKAAHAN